MLRFAVCDDEPVMLDRLRRELSAYLEGSGLAGRVEAFPSGEALLACGGPFDLALLDIRMEPPDGLETARLLRARGFGGPLIFVTALREEVFASFEAQPFDYLVKPVSGDRLRLTLDRAVRCLRRDAPRGLVVQKNGGCRVVPLAELVYCEVWGRKLFLHRKGGEVLDCCGRLGELEKRLDGRFFRCHRSYLVNLDFVGGCAGGQAALPDGGRVPVSRSRERALVRALLARMSGRWA